MSRLRFTENPVDDLLTFSEYTGMYYEEPLILHYMAQKSPFSHWSDHLHYFGYSVSNEEPHNKCENAEFDLLKNEIIFGLRDSGFPLQADEIMHCCNETELNYVIINQYTDETNLHKVVNQELRTCHHIQKEPNPTNIFLKEKSSKLSAWILQLNTAIRHEAEYTDTAYRGATLTPSQINEYRDNINEIVIWAPFISASKNKSECMEGNVLFQIRTESSISEYNKRFPRSISHLSVFPYEDEVIYPIACAYRIIAIEDKRNKTVISLSTVDHN